MDYEHRALLYEMLNRPNWGADDISKDIGWSQNMVSRMIDEIVATFRDMNDYAKED
jgi:hypothetical protein